MSAIQPPADHAAIPGLPFVEDFSDTNLRDEDLTNANWDTEEEELVLAWRRAQYWPFVNVSGSNISADEDQTTSIAIGDLDGDGNLDLVAGNYGQTNRLYLNNGTTDPFDGVSGSDISADAQFTYAVALGDMDGDGDLDLVVGNSGHNRIYLNNGTTDPFNGVNGSNISDDIYTTFSLALGDVDKDGDLDLVAGNRNQTNRLYLNNGTGSPFVNVSGSDISADIHNTFAVALGDMDGDSHLDLVVGNQYQTNRLYLNNGTASPFSGVIGSDISSDEHNTVSVALGDVDGDKDLDLVVGNYGQANRLYLNNGSLDPFDGVSGSGIFGSDGTDTTSLALGDVDGDGALDLVEGNSNWLNRVHLNNGTTDPFQFDSYRTIFISGDSNHTTDVVLGDVDGDGDLDLAAGNSGEANRLYVNSSSENPFNSTWGDEIGSEAQNTNLVALGDVDGDGDPDLVVGNGGQPNHLYLNNGTPLPFLGVNGSNITLDEHSTSSLALGDMDGDGDLDLVAGNYGQTNRLYLNNGTADPFSGVSGLNITADVYDTRSLAMGDVDNDGDLDLVVGNYNQANRLYLNNGGSNPFSGVVGSDISAAEYNTYALGLGDVDGDGDLDLVEGNAGEPNYLYLNNGSSDPFNAVSGSEISDDAHSTRSIALGDVDQDGDLDLVAGNRLQANRLYLNNGTADPFLGTSGNDITTDAYDTRAINLADVDVDGDLDIVEANYGQANQLYLNNGTANPFLDVIGDEMGADAHNTRSIAVGDVNGDGEPDLVVGNANQVNMYYQNFGKISYFGGVVGTEITSDEYDTYSLAIGDMDRDGDLDIATANYSQPNRLYLNNGTEHPFSGITGVDISADTHNTWSLALGDVDGDGDLDLVEGNRYQANRLYLNNGTADPFNGVSGVEISADAHDTYAVELGDVDGDGDLDLVAGNYGDVNILYQNNGTADPFSHGSGTAISADAWNTQSLALGDVDGDGDLDLVVGNSYTDNQLYLNNGTANPFSGVTGSDIAMDFHDTKSLELGDVDRDGDLDLVVGNFNERNRLYLNNGTGDPFAGVTGSDIGEDERLTQSVALGDLDGDGDLDFVAANFSQNYGIQIFSNNGAPNPFSHGDSTIIRTRVRSLNLGDFDQDAELDVVTIAPGDTTKLFRRSLYHSGQGKAGSLRVDSETKDIFGVYLTPDASLPVNTSVTYWLSNNGGVQWYMVRPGEHFLFPTEGMDLRWRAELNSLSPVLTPHINQINIDRLLPVYLPLVMRDPP